MKRPVTDKQLHVLQLIYDRTRQEGFPPTMIELRDALGVASNQSVLNFLQALEKHGYIQRVEGQARSITILPPGLQALGKPPLVPFAGETSGGSYIAPSRVASEWVELPAHADEGRMRRSASELFAVQVYGESMVKAGIRDKDIVLVRKQETYRPHDIVVAHTEEGTTVKRLKRSGRRMVLSPENDGYKIIPCASTTVFDGRVIFNLTRGTALT